MKYFSMKSLVLCQIREALEFLLSFNGRVLAEEKAFSLWN